MVAFRARKDDNVVYVKRVVGLPGDRIQVKQGALYINDAAVKRERLADFVGGDSCGEDPADKVKRWRETLPNGVSYEVLDCVDTGFYDNTGIYEVPAGQFFVMGDNRDNSSDSRAGNFGTNSARLPHRPRRNDLLFGRARFGQNAGRCSFRTDGPVGSLTRLSRPGCRL